MATTAGTRTTNSVNGTVGYVIGAVFLLVGILGWFVSGGHGFADRDGGSLLGFQVNPLHNIVHLLVGVVLLLEARAADWPPPGRPTPPWALSMSSSASSGCSSSTAARTSSR
jgi:hypothetical protein